jgi:CBS domain-containing protein
MALLREIRLIGASVRKDGTFLEAARSLLGSETSALAVVDEQQRVVGLFTDDDLLRGLFPRYLEELHHTAFLVEDGESLRGSLAKAADQSVERHMRKPVTVEIDAGAAHVVERFLHTPWGAVAVVDSGRFVGMVNQLDVTRYLVERLDPGSAFLEMG